MNHLSAEQLNAHLDAALTGRDREHAEHHVAECSACREALAALAAQDQELRPLLTHEPGEEYFDTFAARVEDRIRAAGLRGAQAHLNEARGAGLGAWLSSPRRLAWVGGVAALVAGAGIVLMTTREVRQPVLRDEAFRDRIAKQASPPSTESQLEPSGPVGAVEGEPTDDDDGTEPSERKESRGADHNKLAKDDEIAASGDYSEEQLKAQPGSKVALDARSGRTTPQRMVQVRRNEGGEDVPVQENQKLTSPPTVAREQAASDKPSGTLGEKRVRKPGVVQPMDVEAERRKDVKSSNSTQRLAAGSPSAGASLLKLEGEGELCGEILDTSGRPVGGAQVAIADLGRTIATTSDGRFCVAAPAGDHELSVMAVGFQQSRQQVRVGGERAQVRVTLVPVSVLGDGVVDSRTMDRDRGAPALGTFSKVEPRDPFLVLPDSVRGWVRNAQDLHARANLKGSARQYDAAAAAWERAVKRLEGDPLESEARFRLAGARFRAWETGPNKTRSAAAIAALTSFLARAPSGTQRDQAMRWLGLIRR